MLRKLAIAVCLIPSIAFAGGPSYRKIENAAEITNVTRGFAKDFPYSFGVAAKISDCTHVIDQAVGVANGNHSYGAVCKVRIGKSAKTMLLCNDLMVGYFSINTHFAVADDEVADFTRRNCYGG